MGNRSVFNGQEARLREIASTSDSMKEILIRFGCKTNSGNYQTLQKYAKLYNIELPVFTNEQYTRAAIRATTQSLDTILVENSTYVNNASLKRRLLHSGLLMERCSICELSPIWNGKKLVLQLDHINGIRTDNRIDNLRLLCPNCHSQTDTFCSKTANRY